MNLVFTRDVVKYLVPKYAKGRSLDIGAETAKYRNIIKSSVSEYITCDVEPGENVDFVEDASNLSFKRREFNTIFCFQVLEHVENAEEVVNEIYRCLTQEGICILTVPFLVPQHSDPEDYRRFTVKGLSSFLKLYNFNILECASYGSTFSIFAEFLKFGFLNPYNQEKHNKVRRATVGKLMKFFYFLDSKGFLQNKDFYGNVYIVAQKNK